MIPSLLISFLMPMLPAMLPVEHTVYEPKTLAVHEYSLQDRYPVDSVNTVFKDNILLAIEYATGVRVDPSHIDWSNVEKPATYTLSLKPGETFAFHDDVLPQYNGKVTKTSPAHFGMPDGFKSDGYLAGDGVCHLASLLYWVAKDAGLDSLAPTRHDFAPVPEVPREFGVSIYSNPFEKGATNEEQNLYITNNKDKAISFVFDYNGNKLTIKALE